MPQPVRNRKAHHHCLRRPRYFIPLTLLILLCASAAVVLLYVWTPFDESAGQVQGSKSGPTPNDETPFGDGSHGDGDDNDEDDGMLPQPLNCPVTERYQLEKRYCAWDRSLEGCFRMFMPLFHEKASWVFLGDYGMSQVVHFISLRWPFPSLVINSRRDPCKNIDYLKMPRQIPWQPPNPALGEGPVAFGKDNPYCTDSQRCWNVLMDAPTIDDTYVEFLVVEYARDVTLPSYLTKTTQETMALYLSTKSPEVCVATAGLHDASIINPETGELIAIDVYIHNVDTYITLLSRTCRNVIWIGLPAVIDDEGGVGEVTDTTTTNPTARTSMAHDSLNCRLMEFNNAVYGIMELRNHENVYVMDVWEKTLRTKHVDKLYMSPKYYSSLARLFTILMTGPEASQ